MIWKEIVGFGGNYMISTTGLIKSLSREIDAWNGNSWYKRTLPERILKGAVNGEGYQTTIFCENVVNRNVKVHQLVAKAFIPNPENKPYVNHKNGIKTDNRMENLEWCTPSENMFHAYRTGLKRKPNHSGTKHPQARLDELQVKVIKNILNYKLLKGVRLAEYFNVTEECIQSIKKNKNWKFVSPIIDGQTRS